MPTTTPVRVELTCENCGKQVTLHFSRDAAHAYHDGCPEPVVKLTTHNPQKLGRVTSDV